MLDKFRTVQEGLAGSMQRFVAGNKRVADRAGGRAGPRNAPVAAACGTTAATARAWRARAGSQEKRAFHPRRYGQVRGKDRRCCGHAVTVPIRPTPIQQKAVDLLGAACSLEALPFPARHAGNSKPCTFPKQEARARQRAILQLGGELSGRIKHIGFTSTRPLSTSSDSCRARVNFPLKTVSNREQAALQDGPKGAIQGTCSERSLSASR